MKNLLNLFCFASIAVCMSTGWAADDLTPLSDEFDDAATLANWSRINVTEGWNADQLEILDIDTTTSGALTIQPYTVSWFDNWRGPLVYKDVTGDFVVTMRVAIDDLNAGDGDQLPNRVYSLCGIMIRTPRAITNPAADWVAGSMDTSPGAPDVGENFVFLSYGYADGAGPGFQFEVKTTRNSDSVLDIDNSPTPTGNEMIIQLARIGEDIICLRQVPGGSWVVHRRYDRADMGLVGTMQVGMVAYTDWDGMNTTDPFTHNGTVYSGAGFNPDLRGTVDYFRFARPVVPAPLVGQDLGPGGSVTDGELLSFLGDNANTPIPVIISGLKLE